MYLEEKQFITFVYLHSETITFNSLKRTIKVFICNKFCSFWSIITCYMKIVSKQQFVKYLIFYLP